ncbi:class I fructose-bisphosphate aldolase [Nocardioides humi]|uniref:fructose-bisphosphate aldolase n=1 Tax=Nocardioides humi TaxID=449461 RepID=A0ABN2A1V1_9ACTN|nr:class I fructose-bisphosphate aldolase [Nocardioides humi]
MRTLADTALSLVSSGRGILAADESVRTMSQRLEAEGVPATEENRRAYRELLVSAPGLRDRVSGVILCDETLRQHASFGDVDLAFPEACHRWGVLPGIKVDTGTTPLAFGEGALVTEGLDGLRDRLKEYAGLGAAFAKWRAVIDVASASDHALKANAHALARYAALCQEQGLVPIVEPEVLCTGDHDLDRCAEVTDRALAAVFEQLEAQHVDLAGMVLKPNLVTPGLGAVPAPADQVAAATLKVLDRRVPPALPGIAFLSGGHDNVTACRYLAAVNAAAGERSWRLTFSFGRALVSDALRRWGGEEAHRDEAQAVLLANCARAADAIAGRAPAAA